MVYLLINYLEICFDHNFASRTMHEIYIYIGIAKVYYLKRFFTIVSQLMDL